MASASRIMSLDQFRGYTVAGMFVVNFLGGFTVVPAILKHHHTYCSYADTIMPQFLFAVGFALRLVLLRNAERDGAARARARAALRCLGLVVLGMVVYRLDGNFRSWADLVARGPVDVLANAFWRSPFQTLVHIGVTGLWVIPVMLAPARIRVAYAVASGLLHLGLSYLFWYDLLHAKRVIDGGLLGFLTWSIPTLAGSLAYDVIVRRGAAGAMKPLLGWGVALMAAGYGIACLNQGGTLVPPPFVPPTTPVDLWTMSQRAGSLSYLTFSTGFALGVYVAFLWLVDLRQWSSGVFAALGQNALAAYLIHLWVDDFVKPFAPRDSPWWWVLAMFAVFFGLTCGMVLVLNRRGLFLRL
jgi:predicted acyltransferase